ncbi:MAG: EAL domain-containing protein [Gammaproteobacteria bacterium]|nr:EAL domain-containing protein [Gammaproteobacteria bacterium]
MAQAKHQTDIDLAQVLTEHTTDAVFLAPLSEDGIHGDFIAVNPTACERLGYSREELLCMNARSLNPSANQERVRAYGRDLMREGLILFEAIHVASDGTQIPVEVTAKRVSINGREYVLSVARDLRINKKLKSPETLFGRLMDHTWDEIYVIESDTLRIMQANKGALDNLGYSSHEIQESSMLDILIDYDAKQFRELTRPLFNGSTARVILETRHQRKGGSNYPVELRLQLSHSEVPPVFFAIAHDISKRKEDEARLNFMANYDSLTGLPNRSSFMESLEYSIALSRRTETLSGLVFIDLDGFKFINDSYGHDVGDQLLVAVGQRLKKTLRKTDFVSRLGGDEFTVIVTNIHNVEGLERVCANIIHHLSEPYELDNKSIRITPSLGVSIIPFAHNENPLELVKQADTAMYQAKRQGKNTFHFYAAALAAYEYRRNQIEDALRRVQTRDELYVLYQPRIDLETLKVIGVETLMRWKHPELGNIGPDEFIPIMESTGVICDTGAWIIEESFQQLRQWCEIDPDFKLSVNISARQFETEEIVEFIGRQLTIHSINAANIEVEITEGVLIAHTEETDKALQALREMGISISLDDFGSGYSSLNYLRQFPIDVIKIDRSFTQDLGRNNEAEVIIETIINLAHNLKLRITAEGVETEPQLAFLQSRRCDEGQGFLFERPVPAETITQLINTEYRG